MRLPDTIETTDQIANFIHPLLCQENLNFHPDTPFCEYTDYANNPIYTTEQCAERERLLDRCFALVGEKVYEIGLPLAAEAGGIRDFAAPRSNYP